MRDTPTILVISDLHIPYHHPFAFKFLKELKKNLRPQRVVCIGDELDYHNFSYHERNPDLPGATEEFEKAIDCLHQLTDIFPKVDVCHSNHGSLPMRKTRSIGLLSRFIRPYEEFLEVPIGWRWHRSINIEKTLFSHQIGANSLASAKTYGFSIVQGHYHSKMDIQHWTNGFGVTCGCLIDDTSPAFDYNKIQIARPLIGTAAIINGQPRLFRL